MTDTSNPPQDMPGGTYDHAPFPGGLEYMFHPYANMGTSNEILVNAQEKGFVIKAGHLDRFYKDYEDATPEQDKEHVEKVRAECAEAQKIYSELATGYGIAIPKFMYVIGEARFASPDFMADVQRLQRSDGPDKKVRQEDELEPVLYTVMERIEGSTSLLALSSHWSRENHPTPSTQQYHQLFGTMARYVADKYVNHEPFYSDFGHGISMLEQFSFGHLERDPEERIYLHDVDPKTWQHDDTISPEENEAVRTEQLNSMLHTLIEEAQFEIPGATEEDHMAIFNDIRQQVERIVTEYPKAAKFLEQIPSQEAAKD